MLWLVPQIPSYPGSPFVEHPQPQYGRFGQFHVAGAMHTCPKLWGIERAQLATGVPKHFHPPTPRLLPQVIGRQDAGR